MENKKNDWLATLLYQPDLTLEQLHDLDITPQNTGIRPRDEYLNFKAVNENPNFITDDNFDEKKFNTFYDNALLLYNDYANKETVNKIASAYEYDPWEWRKGPDAKTVDTSSKMTFNPNPMRETAGIRALDKSTPSQYSIREIAQTQRYFNTDTGEFAEQTPNDFAGVFKSYTAPTLVLATYDEDTEEVVNGRTIVHPKGSYKTNALGAPYYRTLGSNEEIYDKDVLHATDIWSVDGSKWNKAIDFFDADGLETEAWKVIAKNIVRVAPFLIPGPVGTVFAGISAAAALTEFVPTLLKAVDGIITNDAMGNDFGRKMNQYEAWLGRLDGSVSDRSREKLVTFENIGKMFGDVSAQLFQQKAVAQLPRLFKNPKIANNQKLGRALSYSFMSATSSEEAYSIFKNAGANDTTAGLATLALMGTYYKLMSSDYFKDILFKGTWLDETHYKEKTWAVIQDFQQAIAKGDVPIVDNPQHAAQTFKWFQNAFEKLIKGAPVTGKNFMQSALSEGVEEVMEEVGIDTLKGIASGLNALGIPVAESNLDFGFGLEDVTRRYLTSFAGGAFGGGLFHGYNLIFDPNARTSKKIAETPESRMAELVYLVSTGKLNDVYKFADKLRRKGLLGSTDLAGTKFDTVTGINGLETALTSSEKEMSQNDFVYNEFVKQLDYINKILSDEGFKKRRDEVASLLNIEDTPTANVATLGNGAGPFAMNASNLILKDLNRLGTQIVQTRAKIDELANSLKPTGDTEYDKSEFEKALKDNDEYKSLLDELKRLRELRDEIYNKENISKYMTQAAIILSQDIMKSFRGFADINDYSMLKYGKPYSEFTPIQQQNIKVEYDDYTNGEKSDPFEIAEIYRVLSEQLTPFLDEKEKLYANLTPDNSVESKTLGNVYIQNIKNRITVKKQYDDLISKENKTEEDLKNIENLLKQLTDLDSAIEIAKSNPAFSTSLVTNIPIDYSTLEEGADLILAHYNNFIGQLKTDDTKLNDFYTDIRRKYQVLDINQILTELTDTENIRDYEGMILPEYEGTFYDNSRDNDIRDEFIRTLKELYSNIGINNTAALENYNQLRSILKDKVGMQDSDIDNLLYNQVEYGLTNVQNDDGTVSQQVTYESLLPSFNGKKLFDFISEIDGIRKQITYSDVTDLLKRFAFNIGDPDLITMLDLIADQEKAIVNSAKLDSYTIDNNAILNQLNKVSAFLEAIDAAISGSFNGLNHIINGYRTKEKKSPFAEISENTAKSLHKNLEILKNRVKFVLDLHDINAGQKLRIQKEIGTNMRVKFLQQLAYDVYIEDFKNKFTKGDVTIDLKQIIEDNTSDGFDLSEINSENFNKYESEIISIETALFNAVQKAGFSNEEIVDNLIAIYGPKSLWKQRNSKLTSDPNVTLTDYDLVLYAASIMSLNANDFYIKYRDTIKGLREIGNYKLVPVFGQEYSLRLAYSFLHNRQLFNDLLNKISETYTGNEKYIQTRRILDNVFSVFGGAGVGKTQGVGYLLSKLFDNVEFRFIAPTNSQTETLLKVFERPGKTEEAYTFEQWFAKFAPNIDAKDNLELVEGSLNVKQNTVKDTPWFSTEDNKLKIILVDEAGLLNSVRLKALSDYATKVGAFVVTLGDYKQNSGTITYDNKGTVTEPDGFEDTVNIKTPTLSATFRAANIAKANNGERLDAILSEVSDKVRESDIAVTFTDRDALLKDYSQIELDYYINGKEISGDYIVNDANSFKTILDSLLDSNFSILVITDENTNNKYSDTKYDGKVTFKSAEQAQGGEYDYVFVDKSIPTSKFAALQDLYTTSQRARLGSVILDVNSEYKNNLKVTSVPNKSASVPYDMTGEQMEDFAKWRLSALENLIPSEQFEQNIEVVNPYKTPSVVKTEPEKPEDTPKKKTPEVPEAKPAEKPVITPGTETKPVITLTDETSKEEYVLTPFDDAEERFSSEPYRESIETAIAASKNSLKTDEFFNFIYSQNFYDSQKESDNSIWSYLKSNNIDLSKEQLTELLTFANATILNNRDFSTDVKSVSINGLTGRQLNKLRTLLSNPSNNYVLCSISEGETSTLSLRISDQTGNVLTYIPFSITHGLPSGTFTKDHKFRFVRKALYEKGKFMTISALKKKYPWLRIAKRGGIIINSDLIQGGNFNERTKQFAKDNDGKAMAFAYDSAQVDESTLLTLQEIPDGTNWLHNQREFVELFGVQRMVKPKELVGYSAALYWLQSFRSVDNRKSLISTLTALGIISNNTVNEKEITKQVCNYLYQLTGNNNWNNTIITDRKFGEEYFSELRKLNDESQIISYRQIERVITDLFGNVLNDGEDLSINNLFLEFGRLSYTRAKDNKRISRRKALLLNFNGQTYMLRVSEYDNEGRPSTIGIYEYNNIDKRTIGEPLYSTSLRIGTFVSDIKTLIQNLMSRYNANLSDFNSSNIRISLKEESWENDTFKGFFDVSGMSELFSIFGSSIVQNDIYEKVLDPKQFQYGIYGNIRRGAVTENAQMAQTDISDDFYTDATEWSGSIYTIDESYFEPGDIGLDNDNRRILLDILNERINTLKTLLKINDLDAFNNAINLFKATNDVDDNVLDDIVNQMVIEVNNYLLNNTTSRTTTTYSYEDGQFIEHQMDSKAFAYSNLLSEFNLSDNNTIIGRFGNTEIVKNGDRVFVFFTNSDGKLLVRETNTYDSWNQIKTQIDAYNADGNFISSGIKAFVNALITDTVTDEIVDNYKYEIKHSSSVYTTSIMRSINNYLEERLIKEEC